MQFTKAPAILSVLAPEGLAKTEAARAELARKGPVLLADAHTQLAELADATMSNAAQSPHASVRARARRLTR